MRTMMEIADGFAEVLRNEFLGVGAEYDIADPKLVIGNMPADFPEFSPVAIDGLGRLWKEVHHGGEHKLVCVLDLRDLAHAIDAGPK